MKPWYEIVDLLRTHKIFPARCHRILISGGRGLGKSTLAESLFAERGYERCTLAPSNDASQLIGQFLLNDNTVWVDGGGIRAMRHGRGLVLDEIEKFSSDELPYLHAILDDLSILRVTLPTGEVVRPEPGFAVLATTNASPTTLPAPILDRFDFVLFANRPHPGILKSMPDDCAAVLSQTYAAREKQQKVDYKPELTARLMLRFAACRSLLPDDLLAAVLFGANGPEVLTAIGSQNAAQKKK